MVFFHENFSHIHFKVGIVMEQLPDAWYYCRSGTPKENILSRFARLKKVLTTDMQVNCFGIKNGIVRNTSEQCRFMLIRCPGCHWLPNF